MIGTPAGTQKLKREIKKRLPRQGGRKKNGNHHRAGSALAFLSVSTRSGAPARIVSDMCLLQYFKILYARFSESSRRRVASHLSAHVDFVLGVSRESSAAHVACVARSVGSRRSRSRVAPSRADRRGATPHAEAPTPLPWHQRPRRRLGSTT